MRVVVRGVFHSRSIDRTCGSIFEGINAVLSAFCETKPLSAVVGQRSTTAGLQRLSMRFVYRIFEYSFVWGYSIRWDLEYSF